MQRKRRELEALKNLESSMPEDLEKADTIRAKVMIVLVGNWMNFQNSQERMTLKHGTMGKWAKKQLAKGHRDPVVSFVVVYPVICD